MPSLPDRSSNVADLQLDGNDQLTRWNRPPNPLGKPHAHDIGVA
jgi:hypothetical protein